MAIPERSIARDLLRDVLDESAIKREVIALAIGCDDGLLGKKLHGTNGRDVGLGEFELLDRDLQVRWFKRYGKVLGLEVREVTTSEVLEQLIDRCDQLARDVRLARIVTQGQIKAEITARDARKVG